jgi:hypothetical protein
VKLRHQRKHGTRGATLLSRRRALQALLGIGSLAAGGTTGLFALRGSAPDVTGLRALSAQSFRTFKALAEAVFSGGPPGMEDPSDELARMFDGYLADEPKWAQDEAQQGLSLLEFGPVIFERRLTTFSHLSISERIAHFEAWAESDNSIRRQAATGFRKFLFLVFYDRPKSWPLIGYEGPLIKAPDQPVQ